MYPLGESAPFGLMDLAGNVWEWTTSENRGWSGSRVLRGGSWWSSRGDARCAYRDWNGPDLSDGRYGFQCVSPVLF